MNTAPPNKCRSGTILIITLFMMIGMLAFVALAVDIGYLSVVRTELQRSADSAAMAGALELANKVSQIHNGGPAVSLATVPTTAGQFAGLNAVATAGPLLGSSDTDMYQLTYPYSIGTLPHPGPAADTRGYNAVWVKVRRDATQNGSVGLFFARIFGIASHDAQAEALAVFNSNFNGFKPPPADKTLNILPFALDNTTWDNLLAGVGTDQYRWDSNTRTVASGADGILEVNLYPQGTGSPGNRGTCDIGGSGNSTNDIKRQITSGISLTDMTALAAAGRSLQFNSSGQLTLNADTGMSNGFESALQGIVGQTRVIPIFSQITGNGNNAEYTIVAFVGVRILHVQLTGNPSGRHVMVQPTNVTVDYGIPSSGNPTSYAVFSPPMLVK